MNPLTVMPGRIAPLGIEIDAVVVRVPSHVLPVLKRAATECLLHRLPALLLKKPRLDRHYRSNARKYIYVSVYRVLSTHLFYSQEGYVYMCDGRY